MVAHHAYFPDGIEANHSAQDSERVKCTGHEQDLRLFGGEETSLTALRLAVPPELRNLITTRLDSRGHTVVAIDGSPKTTDVNFKNLQRAVNSPGIVQINETSRTSSFCYKDDGVTKTATLKDLKGVTLPTSGTAGNTSITSTTQGVMQVHIDSSFSAYEQAPIVAAELAGHAVPGLLGEGAAAPEDEEHHEREDPAKVDAIAKSRLAGSYPITIEVQV